MRQRVEHILLYAVDVIDIIAVMIILYGVLRSMGRFLTHIIRKQQSWQLSRVRLKLWRHLLFGMECMIASDIIYTIITPDMEWLILLAWIVAIRIATAYFLEKEIERLG